MRGLGGVRMIVLDFIGKAVVRGVIQTTRRFELRNDSDGGNYRKRVRLVGDKRKTSTKSLRAAKTTILQLSVSRNSKASSAHECFDLAISAFADFVAAAAHLLSSTTPVTYSIPSSNLLSRLLHSGVPEEPRQLI